MIGITSIIVLFQLMNFLRVIQYAKEERTVAFLKNVLNSIL